MVIGFMSSLAATELWIRSMWTLEHCMMVKWSYTERPRRHRTKRRKFHPLRCQAENPFFCATLEHEPLPKKNAPLTFFTYFFHLLSS